MAEFPSYTSLYRRFRPQRFAEVLGQAHVTKALKNAVSQDRVSHAYMFSGPRGTGKTSTARILAKALNCLAPIDGEPCCECSSCVSIAEGRSFDVVELDAASNSGVDAIRSLIAQTPTGTLGKWKVYIIDEVHMLTAAASNALLKTLEEPPSHVVFVLATTDPQKVISTIKSRSQHYEFHLLDEATLGELVSSVRERAGLDFDAGAVDWLLTKGRGSARDTLSYLDQIVALGYVPESKGDIERLLGVLSSGDVKATMDVLEDCIRAGRDPQRICQDLIDLLRSRFLESVGIGEGADSQPERDTNWLVRALTMMGESLVQMRDSLDPRVILEVALVRLVSPESDPVVSELLRRVENLEREISQLKLRELPNPTRNDTIHTASPTPTESDSSPKARGGSRKSESPSQMRERISEAPSPSQLRSKDELARLKSVVSDARASGASRPAVDEENGEGQPSPSEQSGPESASGHVETEEAGTTSEEKPDGEALPTDVAEANSIFRKEVLPTLSPRARSLFAAARVVASGGLKIVLSVPNEAHRSHAVANLGDVRKAFERRFPGLDAVLELTSDDKLGDAGSSPVQEHDTHDELIEQFSSAPEARAGDAESQILDVFPGAKKIQQ